MVKLKTRKPFFGRQKMNVMHFKAADGVKKTQSAPVRIDVDRMNFALSAERFTLPQGLSVEEARKHIIASAGGK
jgi:hypothetical protein